MQAFPRLQPGFLPSFNLQDIAMFKRLKIIFGKIEIFENLIFTSRGWSGSTSFPPSGDIYKFGP